MTKVLIVGNVEHQDDYCSYRQMYLANGFKIVYELSEADLVQFTGGEDVSPSLYGHDRHTTTGNNPYRDEIETAIYLLCAEQGIPCVGICRGGQFLNVMNGGTLFQDVSNHALCDGHLITDAVTYEQIHVSSTHHQMMKSGNGGKIVAFVLHHADSKVIFDRDKGVFVDVMKGGYEIGSPVDEEVVYYGDTKTLCFQPHPEFFHPKHECQLLFFRYLDEYLGVKSPLAKECDEC